MQLNASTDYAIRLTLYLAKTKSVVSSNKIAEALDISSRYLLQIGTKLRDAGLITTTYGPSGGFKLIGSPKEISLFDIILVMEEMLG